MEGFTLAEIEAATRVIELQAQGGDASVLLRGEAHRSYLRKLFELRAAMRSKSNGAA